MPHFMKSQVAASLTNLSASKAFRSGTPGRMLSTNSFRMPTQASSTSVRALKPLSAALKRTAAARADCTSTDRTRAGRIRQREKGEHAAVGSEIENCPRLHQHVGRIQQCPSTISRTIPSDPFSILSTRPPHRNRIVLPNPSSIQPRIRVRKIAHNEKRLPPYVVRK